MCQVLRIQSDRRRSWTRTVSRTDLPCDGLLGSFLCCSPAPSLDPFPPSSAHPALQPSSPPLSESPLLLGTGLLASTPSAAVQIPKGSQAGQDNEQDAGCQPHSQACYIHSSTPCSGEGGGGTGSGAVTHPSNPVPSPRGRSTGREARSGAEPGPLPRCVTPGD